MNIVKAGNLNLKFTSIKFRVTLPKHHAGIGAVERIIGSIKNTVNKSLTGPHQLIMDDEELLTRMHGVIDKLNNRPLILGAPLSITLTHNQVLQRFRSVLETRSTLHHPSINRSPGGMSSLTCSTHYGSRSIPDQIHSHLEGPGQSPLGRRHSPV